MRTRSSLLAALLLATLATGALAGCGSGGGGTAQPGDNVSSSASPGSSEPTPPLPPSGRVSPAPDQSSKYPAAELTLTGRPEEGVEFNCLIMKSGGTTYQLLGGDQRLLRSGQTVIVKGRPNPGLFTTCQQGIPFEVSEVRPA